MELTRKRKYTVPDFLNLINLLRSPKGCLWDRAQTHMSIRTNLIEEAYEAMEAIDLGDSDMLKEELGDILLQIAFHCNIEEKENNFSFEDVVDDVCRKIILRHPHIFSNQLSSIEQPRRASFEIKHRNNSRHFLNIRSQTDTPAESVKNISKTLPALMRTVKVQGRAARAGYGLFSVEDALNETFEKLHYLETLIVDGHQEDYGKELGDLLFAVTEVSRLISVDPESALYDSCERFKDEFLYKMSLENRNKV